MLNICNKTYSRLTSQDARMIASGIRQSLAGLDKQTIIKLRDSLRVQLTMQLDAMQSAREAFFVAHVNVRASELDAVLSVLDKSQFSPLCEKLVKTRAAFEKSQSDLLAAIADKAHCDKELLCVKVDDNASLTIAHNLRAQIAPQAVASAGHNAPQSKGKLYQFTIDNTLVTTAAKEYCENHSILPIIDAKSGIKQYGNALEKFLNSQKIAYTRVDAIAATNAIAAKGEKDAQKAINAIAK